MPPKRLTLAQLNHRLIDEIGIETYARLLIKGAGLHIEDGSPRTLRAGNIHGDPGNSFSLILEGPLRGRWREFNPHGSEGAERGDLLDLTASVRRCSIADAAMFARAVLDGRELPEVAAPPRRKPEPQPSRDPDRNMRIAQQIWNDRQPIAGTAAERYLIGRSLQAPAGAALGFVPRLKCPGPDRRYFPALIGGFQQLDGTVTGILRIFLAQDGIGKADLPNPKMMLGSCGGCAVRLTPAAATLYVSEGIETGLAYLAMNPGAATWTPGAARGFPNLQLPEAVREVVFLGERNDEGEPDSTNALYVNRAIERLGAEGRRGRVEYPDSGKDHNDALLARSRPRRQSVGRDPGHVSHLNAYRLVRARHR